MRPALPLLVALIARPTAAADADLRQLFPGAADVAVESPGELVRLPLPAAVLAACRPDLADLRVFDAQGREVAYLVDAGSPARVPREVSERRPATVLSARRDEVRRDPAPPLQRETYVLEPPPADADVANWDLVFHTERARFVRRVDVSVEAADGGAVSIVEDGSIFRLPNVADDRTRLALPPLSGARLTVTLEGDDGTYLEPRLAFAAEHVVGPHAEAVVALEEIGRRRVEGRTILEVVRPRGLVPDVVRIDTSSQAFSRTVEVYDAGPGVEDELLGRATVFRMQAVTAVDEHEVPLRPARGDRLRVEIDDGDSAPLDGLVVSAAVRQPALVFALEGGGDPAATVYFGGGRAYRPRYDVARLAARREPGATAVGRLGPVRPNPLFDGAPALAFAMRPGAEIDTGLYRARRAIRVEPSVEGLSRLVLAPDDVASARSDLADVRVADAEGRQWPYLLEADGAREWWPLALASPVRREGTSRFRLGLPAATVRLDEIVLETDTAFFDRSYVLVARMGDGGDETTLVRGRLVQRVGRPRPVTIDFPPARVASLELVVEDGDDAPLALRTARARLVLPEIFLAAPAGVYALLLGDPHATPPRYELARVRDVVLAARSAPVSAEPLAPNPGYSMRARLAGGGLAAIVPQAVLWTVLVAAVVILTLVTLRVARSASGAPPDEG
jgi:hypothetical protein